MAFLKGHPPEYEESPEQLHPISQQRCFGALVAAQQGITSVLLHSE